MVTSFGFMKTHEFKKIHMDNFSAFAFLFLHVTSRSEVPNISPCIPALLILSSTTDSTSDLMNMLIVVWIKCIG